MKTNKRPNSHSYFNFNKRPLKSKCSQITLFVVLALIIIIAVILAFFIMRAVQRGIGQPLEPKTYMEQCVAKSLERHEDFLIKGNLYPNRTINSIKYQGEYVPYLCSVSQFYSPCVNQEPMLLVYTEKNLSGLVKPDAEKCFSNLIKLLKKRGYKIDEQEGMNLSIKIRRGKITANIEKRFTTRTDVEIKTYENFASSTASPLYRLIDTARNIINFESETCEFNDIGWMIYYRDISINKFTASEGSKVYTLTDKATGKSIKFAVKSCLWPAGI